MEFSIFFCQVNNFIFSNFPCEVNNCIQISSYFPHVTLKDISVIFVARQPTVCVIMWFHLNDILACWDAICSFINKYSMHGFVDGHKYDPVEITNVI